MSRTLTDSLAWRDLLAELAGLDAEALRRIAEAPADAWTARDTYWSDEGGHWSSWQHPTKFDLYGWIVGPWTWDGERLICANRLALPLGTVLCKEGEQANPFVGLQKAFGLTATVAAVQEWARGML